MRNEVFQLNQWQQFLSPENADQNPSRHVGQSDEAAVNEVYDSKSIAAEACCPK